MTPNPTRPDATVLAAQLAAIVESSDDAILSEDLDGVVMSWNGGAERTFGYPAAEMIGTPFARLIPPERQEEEEEILGKIGRGERVGRLETVRVRKDGATIHVSVTVSPILDADGRVIGVSKVARDITGRRQAEQRLAWLASFPERSPHPVVEVDEETGEVHYWNLLARQLFPDLGELRFAHPLLDGIEDVARDLRACQTDVVVREIAVRGPASRETAAAPGPGPGARPLPAAAAACAGAALSRAPGRPRSAARSWAAPGSAVQAKRWWISTTL